MNAKTAALGLTLGLATLLAAGCGPASTCSSTTCQGCCDSAGACQGGDAASACGFRGGSCVTCKSDQTCGAGVCKGPAKACTACTATQCCDTNSGVCRGIANATCGLNGTACSACAGSSVCGLSQGVCVTPAVAAGVVGAACTQDADCQPGVVTGMAYCIKGTQFPGGFCSDRCGTPDTPCTAGQVCLNFANIGNICAQTCPTVGANCGPSNRNACDHWYSGKACVPACSSATQADVCASSSQYLSCQSGLCCGIPGYTCCRTGTACRDAAGATTTCGTNDVCP